MTKKGRQRERWEDIRKWTGLWFGKSQRAVEKSEKWRKLVANSSVVPQRPSRLRDRLDEREMCVKHVNCVVETLWLVLNDWCAD